MNLKPDIRGMRRKTTLRDGIEQNVDTNIAYQRYNKQKKGEDDETTNQKGQFILEKMKQQFNNQIFQETKKIEEQAKKGVDSE